MPESNSKGTERAVWAVMQFGRSHSLDDLTMVCDEPADGILRYLEALIRQGYVRMRTLRRLPSGETLPLFSLLRWTGPEAPHVEGESLDDPNLAVEDPVSAMKREGPPLAAHVRLAAMRLGPRRLTTGNLMDFLRIRTDAEVIAFKRTVTELIRTGELRRDGDALMWRGLKTEVQAIREYFEARHGEDVTSTELSEALGEPLQAAHVRQALDLFRAEGFKVTRRIRKRKGKVYQVYGVKP
jgi:hypothetical protein